MKSIPIKLSFAEEVKTFVNIVNRYPFDMDLRAGRHVVDAKSILGIFRSVMIKDGSYRSTASRAAAPSAASPTTTQSSADQSMVRMIPFRTILSSSTTTTLYIVPLLPKMSSQGLSAPKDPERTSGSLKVTVVPSSVTSAFRPYSFP